MTTEQAALVVAQFVLCSCIGWACMCRINLMSRRTLRLYRAGYSLMLAIATAVGFAPVLLDELPNRASVLMCAGALVVVFAGLRNWRGGAPHYTERRRRRPDCARCPMLVEESRL